jgi:hypothetical protein
MVAIATVAVFFEDPHMLAVTLRAGPPSAPNAWHRVDSLLAFHAHQTTVRARADGLQLAPAAVVDELIDVLGLHLDFSFFTPRASSECGQSPMNPIFKYIKGTH